MRRTWFEAQPDLDPARLVFIDETWAKTNMARTHGRCRRGERLRMGVPHGHWSEGPARHRFERSPERRLSSER